MPSPAARPEAPAFQIASQIRLRSVDELVPYARNSRTHSERQIEQVAASIREFGFTVPVLCDESGIITAGHARVLAAKMVGLLEVPTIDVSYLSEAQRRAYVIADNKLAENAGWDDELLALELADLGGLGFDLSLTGFDIGELDRLIGSGNGEDTPPSEFREYDENIPIEHQCPKCGYRFSGASTVVRPEDGNTEA